MKVFKFGGASVKNAEAVRNVATIIRNYNQEKLMVIISAMGKTTNALEDVLNAYLSNDERYKERIEQVKKFHFDILDELYDGNDTNPHHQLEDLFLQFEWFFELGEKDNYDFLYDQIVGFGEIFSTKIVTTYLQHVGIAAKWIDARNFIITNDNYREAAVDFKLTESMVNKKIPPMLNDNVLISQGFIGKNRHGHATTLGREGSDFSAAIFAWALNAQEVCIWKDVPGILNADPKRFTDTVKFDHLSYTDAVEMSYYGASVLHPKTMQPLQNKKIPLHVRSFINFNENGTLVKAQTESRTDIPVIILKENQWLINISANNFSFIAEKNLSRIFASIAENRVKLNLMRNSAIRFTLCTDGDERKVNSLVNDLQDDYHIEVIKNLKLLTVRHYTRDALKKLLDGNKVLVEQKIERTKQFVIE